MLLYNIVISCNVISGKQMCLQIMQLVDEIE